MYLNKLKKINFYKLLIFFIIKNNIFGMEQSRDEKKYYYININPNLNKLDNSQIDKINDFNNANIPKEPGIDIYQKDNGKIKIKYDKPKIIQRVKGYMFEDVFNGEYYKNLKILNANFFKGMTNKEIKKFLKMNSYTGVNGFYSDNILTCVSEIQYPMDQLFYRKIISEEFLMGKVTKMSNIVEEEVMKLSRILSQYANGKMGKGKRKAQKKYEQYIKELKNENNYQNNQEQNNNNNNFQQNQQIEKK